MSLKIKTLVAFLLYLPVQLCIMISWYPSFIKVSQGLANLDSRLIYTEVEVLELFSALGESGSRVYQSGVILDFAYIILMALLVYLFLTLLTIKFESRLFKTINISLVAIYILMDILENISILGYINSTIEGNAIEISRLAISTPLKHSMLYLTLVYIIGIVVISLVKKIKKAA